MRLTDRGRVVFGVVATGIVLLAHHALAAAPASGRPAVLPAAAAAVGPTPSPSPTGRPSPTASRSPASNEPAPPGRTAGDAPIAGVGALLAVSGTTAVGGSGPLRRYRVLVEQGTGEDPSAFAAAVQSTLTDRRSWGAHLSFQRVDSEPVAFTVVLAAPASAEALCQPLDIQYRLSCFQHGRSVINDERWRQGAAAYAGDLAAYRHYVINHEVGHALGHHHEQCAGAGQLAPVMMQQTKGVGACRANPWVYPAG